MLLLASSAAAWFGERGILHTGAPAGTRRIRRGASSWGPPFVIVQWFEWHAKAFSLGTSSYASLYFVTTGFHIGHVIVGTRGAGRDLWLDGASTTSARAAGLTVSAGVVYWHFVDIVWLFVFATYYITPYLGFGNDDVSAGCPA